MLIVNNIAFRIARLDPATISGQVPWSTSGANDNGLIRLRNDHKIGDPLRLETTQSYNKVGVKRFNLRHHTARIVPLHIFKIDIGGKRPLPLYPGKLIDRNKIGRASCRERVWI